METAHTDAILNPKERFFINQKNIEALLENIPHLIYMKDVNGNYITGTKQAQSFVNKGFDIFQNLHLDVLKTMNTNLAEDKFVIENNKIITNEREFYDLNGHPHCYQIYKALLSDYKNKVVGIAVMVNNVDKAKLLEAQRETFVASLGHDLKNPTLAQIRAVELLLKGSFGEIPDAQREILEMVLDSCRYMSAMLASLLATYRNERGVVRLNYEKISLEDLVMECISEMIYIAKDKEVGVSIHKEDCVDPTFYGDKVQIKRVIMNLLSNGIKYAFRKSTLHISIYNEKNFTCFKFENNSPYIPPDKRESIFAQYVSFADTHKELGIGLGLYASQKIVEAHEGEIFVESYEDERSIFGFKIPTKIEDKEKPRSVTF